MPFTYKAVLAPQGLSLNSVTGDSQWFADAGYVQSVDEVNTQCLQSVIEAGDFSPVLKWEWSGSSILGAYDQVISIPVVVPLEDTNADGQINQLDIPSTAFCKYATYPSLLMAGLDKSI